MHTERMYGKKNQNVSANLKNRYFTVEKKNTIRCVEDNSMKG